MEEHGTPSPLKETAKGVRPFPLQRWGLAPTEALFHLESDQKDLSVEEGKAVCALIVPPPLPGWL